MFPLERDEVERMQDIAGNARGSGVEMAKLLRQIGRDRATPEVLMQQLKLLKHRETAAATRAELMLVRIFSTVVAELDQFEKDWAAEQEAAKPQPEAPPLPIEETTYRAVDEGGF